MSAGIKAWALRQHKVSPARRLIRVETVSGMESPQQKRCSDEGHIRKEIKAKEKEISKQIAWIDCTTIRRLCKPDKITITCSSL